jgi:hypothetical protein
MFLLLCFVASINLSFMDDKEFALFIGILILLIKAFRHLTLHHHDLMVMDCLSNSMSYSLE